MKVSVAKERLLKCLRSANRTVLCLEGPAGIGKSHIVKEACMEAGFTRYVDLRLATQEAGDLVGFPKTIDEFTYWTLPSWWPLKQGMKSPITGQIVTEDERVVIFCDELNRAPQDVRQAIFQLLTDFAMHTHTLTPGSKVIVAINPADGSYQVEELDKALNNRMCILQLTTDAEQWVSWGKNHGVYEKILEFLTVQPELILQESKENKPFPSPRTWTLLSSMYADKCLEHGDVDEFEIMAGLVGKEAAAAFSRYQKEHFQKYVTAKEIFSDYDAVKDKFMKQRDDETHATLSDITSTLNANEAKTGKKVDEMFKTTSVLLKDITKNDYKVALVHKMTSKQRSRLLQADPTLGKLISDIVTQSQSGQAPK